MPLLATAHALTWLQAAVIGLLQGVTELFPVSSLGHSVLLPAIFGWHNVVNSESAKESFYLAFLVGLHVATALALLVFFWRDWVRILRGGLASVLKRRVETADERLFWLLVLVTIPVGVIALALESKLRTEFAKPTAAAVFLFINGLVLLTGEQLRRRDQRRSAAGPGAAAPKQLATLGYGEGVIIGCFQSFALLAGISRSGITMVGGLARGLSHEDAARFSFLAATPVILAAGVLKANALVGSDAAGVRGQILLGSLLAAAGAYVSVRFLVKYFETRTLTPFAIYCLVAGGVLAVGFGTGVF